MVHNVPLATYDVWRKATRCNFGLSDADLAFPLRPAIGMSYPAIVSLAAFLTPRPGDQVLHLNSGRACLASAWALLLPRTIFSCVEPSTGLHRAAVQMLPQLDASVQQRVHLHNCDPLDTVAHWGQSNILIVSADVF